MYPYKGLNIIYNILNTVKLRKGLEMIMTFEQIDQFSENPSTGIRYGTV